jgi:hypothetical protein
MGNWTVAAADVVEVANIVEPGRGAPSIAFNYEQVSRDGTFRIDSFKEENQRFVGAELFCLRKVPEGTLWPLYSRLFRTSRGAGFGETDSPTFIRRLGLLRRPFGTCALEPGAEMEPWALSNSCAQTAGPPPIVRPSRSPLRWHNVLFQCFWKVVVLLHELQSGTQLSEGRAAALLTASAKSKPRHTNKELKILNALLTLCQE